MDLLQRHLPRVFEALQSALEYIGAVANLVFGDASPAPPPPPPNQDADSSTLPRAEDLTDNKEEVEVPSKSSPDITDSDLEKDSFSCIEVSTNTLDLSAQWSRVTLRRVSSLKTRTSAGPQHGSISDACQEEAPPCLLTERQSSGGSEPGGINEFSLEDSLLHHSSDSQSSDRAPQKRIHRTCSEDLTVDVGTQRRSAEGQQPAGFGDHYLEEDSPPGASNDVSMPTFCDSITELTSELSSLSQGDENEVQDGEGKEEEEEALNLTGNLLKEMEEYLRGPMVPAWGVKDRRLSGHKGANSMGEEADPLQRYKREEQPTCEEDQVQEIKPTHWRVTTTVMEEWKEERLNYEENDGSESHGTPPVTQKEEEREENKEQSPMADVNEDEVYQWSSAAALYMKDKEEDRRVSSNSEEEENMDEHLQGHATVSLKEGDSEEESVGEETREKALDERASDTEREEVRVVERKAISSDSEGLEIEGEESQDRYTLRLLHRGIKEEQTGMPMDGENEDLEKTQWKDTARWLGQVTGRRFVENEENKSHVSSTLTHQDDLTSEIAMEEEDEGRKKIQQKITVTLQEQVRKERLVEKVEEKCNVTSTLTLQDEVRPERFMFEEKGMDECDNWLIATLHRDASIVAREVGFLGERNKEEDVPQTSTFAMREQNMEGKVMDGLELKTYEEERSQRGFVTLEKCSEERDREEISVNEDVSMIGVIADPSKVSVTKQKQVTMTEQKEKPVENYFPGQENEENFDSRIIVQDLVEENNREQDKMSTDDEDCMKRVSYKELEEPMGSQEWNRPMIDLLQTRETEDPLIGSDLLTHKENLHCWETQIMWQKEELKVAQVKWKDFQKGEEERMSLQETNYTKKEEEEDSFLNQSNDLDPYGQMEEEIMLNWHPELGRGIHGSHIKMHALQQVKDEKKEPLREDYFLCEKTEQSEAAELELIQKERGDSKYAKEEGPSQRETNQQEEEEQCQRALSDKQDEEEITKSGPDYQQAKKGEKEVEICQTEQGDQQWETRMFQKMPDNQKADKVEDTSQKKQCDIQNDGDDDASQREPDNLQEMDIVLKKKEDVGAWVGNSWVKTAVFENVQGGLDNELELSHKKRADPQHAGKVELYRGEVNDHQEVDNTTHCGQGYQKEDEWEQLGEKHKKTSKKELGSRQIKDEEEVFFQKDLGELQVKKGEEEEEEKIHQKQSGDLQVEVEEKDKEEEKMSQKEHNDRHSKEGVEDAFPMEQTDIPEEQGTPEWVQGDKQKEEKYIFQFLMEHSDLDLKKGEEKEKTSMMENGDLQEEGENKEMGRTQVELGDNQETQEIEEAKATYSEHSDQQMDKETFQWDQVDLHREQEGVKDEAPKMGEGDLQEGSGEEEGTSQKENVDQLYKEDSMSHKKSVTEEQRMEEEASVGKQVLEEERGEGATYLGKPDSEEEGREEGVISLGEPVSVEGGLEGDTSLGTTVSEKESSGEGEIFVRETVTEKRIFEGPTFLRAPQSDKKDLEVGDTLLTGLASENLGEEEEDTCRAAPRSEREGVERELYLGEFVSNKGKLEEESSHEKDIPDKDGKERFVGQPEIGWGTEGEISLVEPVPENEVVEKWASLGEQVLEKWVEVKEISLGESVAKEARIEEAMSPIESASEGGRKREREPSLGEPISKEVRDDQDVTPEDSLLETDEREGRETPMKEVVSEEEGEIVRKSSFILEKVEGMEELYLREHVSKEVQENPEASLEELILGKEGIDKEQTFQREAVSEEKEGMKGESHGGESESEQEEGRVEEETSLRESVPTARKRREENLQESAYEKQRREAGGTLLGQPMLGEEKLVTRIFLGELESEHEGGAFMGEPEPDIDRGEEGDTSREESIAEREKVKGEPCFVDSISDKERVEAESLHGGSVSEEDRREERETFWGEPPSDGKMREETSQRETLLEVEREEGELYLGELVSEEVKLEKEISLREAVSHDVRVETEMALMMQELEEEKADVALYRVELVLEDRKVMEETYTREPLSEEGQEEKESSQGELASDEGRVEEETSHRASITSEGRKEGERCLGEVAKEEITVIRDSVQQEPVCEDWQGEAETSLKKEVPEEERVDTEVCQMKPVTEGGRGEAESYVREPISDDSKEEEEGHQEELVSNIEKMERSLDETICKKWNVQEETSLRETVLDNRRVGVDTSEKTTLLKEQVERETSLGGPGSEEWTVERGTYMRESESKDDGREKGNVSLGKPVLKHGRAEGEASLQGPSYEGQIVEEDTTLWEPILEDERMEDEISLVELVSDKGRVEEEESLGEPVPVEGRMKFETCIEQPVSEGRMEAAISMEESASEKEKVERETSLGNTVSEERGGVEKLIIRVPESEEGRLKEERHLKQSWHPPQEEEQHCQSLTEPNVPPQELGQEEKTISDDQPNFKHISVIEEMHRSSNKSEYLFQKDVWIPPQEPSPGSILESDRSLNHATYPLHLETGTVTLAEAVCLPLLQKGEVALNSYEEREEDVILLQESECAPDLVNEKDHMDKAKGQESKDNSILLGMQSDYSLEKRTFGQTGGPMQHQRKELMVSPAPHPRHLDITEKTQVQKLITDPERDNAVKKMAFTRSCFLPPIVGTGKVDESTQDFKEGDTFKREPSQVSEGKMEDTTSPSLKKEAPEGQTVSTVVEKDKKKEAEIDGLFGLEEVQTLDVSAQKSRIHLRRKVSVRRRQDPALWPHSDHDTSTKTKEPALPSTKPPSKLLENQPMPLPVHETHVKPAQWTGPGEGLPPPPPTVLPKPRLIPGMMPIMMPGMVRPPHPQLILGSSATEKSVTEDSMAAEVIAPKKKFPGHAGFGFAHPQMMQELQFRLRKPKPQ
ncbi:trichohyalin-like isoform X1 [Pleurodeles waltl]|uniref:trichohyalin-like isoform X1 n=1 Tax=Pleurodeles waltl TaxID=8319 RepID=UPI003709823C